MPYVHHSRHRSWQIQERDNNATLPRWRHARSVRYEMDGTWLYRQDDLLHNGGGGRHSFTTTRKHSSRRTMPIVICCPCGKQLNLADDLAGAKIKCPACQAVLGVPAPVQDNPFPLAQPILPKDRLRSQEEMWDETDERLRRRRDKHETPRSTTRLYFYIGSLLLILFLGLGCGIGGWFYFYAFTGNELVGSWEAEGGGAGRVRFGRAGDAAVTPMGGVTQHGA